MSHPLTRRGRVRAGRVLGGAAVLGAIAVAIAVPAAGGRLLNVPAALGPLLDVDLPRWIHNLADLLQILTAVVAFLAWEGARRARR
jgi:hypothetical protein